MKRSTLIFLAIFLLLLYASIAVAQNFGALYALPILTLYIIWAAFGVCLFDLQETNAKK
jgi:UPF0716 family protein affecting phage T7 exclusion